MKAFCVNMELLLSEEQFPCEATDWKERQKSSLTWQPCHTSFHSFYFFFSPFPPESTFSYHTKQGRKTPDLYLWCHSYLKLHKEWIYGHETLKHPTKIWLLFENKLSLDLSKYRGKGKRWQKHFALLEMPCRVEQAVL